MKSKAAATIIMSALILTGLTACNGKQDCNSTQQALIAPDSVAEKGGAGGGGGGHASGGSAGHGTAGEGSAGHSTTGESGGGTTAKGGTTPVVPFVGGGSGSSCKK